MPLTSHDGGARALLDAALSGSTVALAWLGQAGFLVRHAGLRLLIDPYLSDHLARKYAGTEFPHTRMMPAPLDAAAVPWPGPPAAPPSGGPLPAAASAAACHSPLAVAAELVARRPCGLCPAPR